MTNTKEFYVLDMASRNHWNGVREGNMFRNLLRTASTEVLNSYDVCGWTFLTYVIWNIRGTTDEMETMRLLLGPEMVTEDHSRVRLDLCIFSDQVYPKHGKKFGVTHFRLGCTKHTVEQVFAHRQKLSPQWQVSNQPLYEENIRTTGELLQSAIRRVSTYPKRFMNAFANVCASYFPVTTLHCIVLEYLVWK